MLPAGTAPGEGTFSVSPNAAAATRMLPHTLVLPRALDSAGTKMPKLLATRLPFYPIRRRLRPELHVLIVHVLGTSF